METVSRRERQILDVLYAKGRATAAEIQAALPDAPSYSAIRALLRILEDKGHIHHEEDGPRYVFLPSVPKERARKSAVQHLLQTFFDNSAGEAMAAMLGSPSARFSPEELDRLETLISEARKGQATQPARAK